MNPRIINVLLTTLGEDKDILQFYLSEENIIEIDLDSSICQSEIKKLFSEILKIAINEDVEFHFKSENDFPRELYRDVCDQYIKDISRELNASIIVIRNVCQPLT